MLRQRTLAGLGVLDGLVPLALLLCVSHASAQPTSTPDKKRDDLLRVSFVDVGQGDAIWIQGPKRHDGGPPINILIDGGPKASSGEKRLLDYLKAYDLPPGSTIDYMILTHPHDDHFPGLTEVLGGYNVKTIIDAGFPKPETGKNGPTSYGDFMIAARKAKGKLLRAHDFPEGKITLDWEDDSAPEDAPTLHAEILAAFWKEASTFGASQNTKENNCSTVVRMEFGVVSFLFMGDAEGQKRKAGAETAGLVEGMLLSKFKDHPEKLAATILKPGHHGSDTSSTLPFMRVVAPDIVVIPSGRKNFKNVFLPDASVIARYKAELPKTTVLRTDEGDAQAHKDTTNDADGDDVYIYTDGESVRAYQAQQLQGKWRWVLKRQVQPPTPVDPG